MGLLSVPMNGIRSDVVRIRPTFCNMLACTAREDAILPYNGAEQPYDTKNTVSVITQRQCSLLFGFQLDDLFYAQLLQILVAMGDEDGGAVPAVGQNGLNCQQAVLLIQTGEGLVQCQKRTVR